MRYKHRLGMGVVALCLGLFLGCSQALVEQIGEMISMHDALVEAYDHEDIAFHMDNGTHLTISFVNSHFNELTWQEKREKAEEIARFSASLLNEHWAVHRLSIRFTIHKKLYLVVDYTNTVATFHFNLDALQRQTQSANAPAGLTGRRGAPCAEHVSFSARDPIAMVRLDPVLQTEGRRRT